MGRLTAELAEVVRSPHVRPFTLVELDMPDGMTRCSSLPFDIVLGGFTYSGLSVLGSLSEITEGAETRSYGVKLTLTGIPLPFAEYLASQRVQGRMCWVYQGFADADHRIIGEPFSVYTGRMDTMDVQVGDTTAVEIATESLLIDWERPRIRRFTASDQMARYPDDKGFDHVARMTNLEIKWGVA